MARRGICLGFRKAVAVQSCPHSPPVISTEARSETTSGAEKSLTLYDCFCNVHLPVFYTLTLLSPCKILRLRAFLFARHSTQDDRTCGEAACRRQGVPATLFRENALLHYQAYCADSRDVILSRRACGASKNLLRFPQSSCSAIVSAFPPPVISTEARSETTSGAEKSLTLYDCFCNVHLPVFYTLTLLSPLQDPSTSRLAIRSALRSG